MQTLTAQEMLSELAALSMRHKAVVEAHGNLRQENISKAAQSYVNALAGVEKSATAKGDLDLVAAVLKECQAALAGTLAPEIPTPLSKVRVGLIRKRLISDIQRINVEFEKRRKKIDVTYLRELTALQAKSDSNPELAKQIAVEKLALLQTGANGVESGSSSKVSRGKNVVVNGDFEKITDGWPDTWKKINNVSVETEHKNQFVRFEDKNVLRDGSTGFSAMEHEACNIPEGAEIVVIEVRLRTNGCVSPQSKSPNKPRVGISWINPNGQKITSGSIFVEWGGKNGTWKKIVREGAIPQDAEKFIVFLFNGNCPGQIDFDDVEVSFK